MRFCSVVEVSYVEEGNQEYELNKSRGLKVITHIEALPYSHSLLCYRLANCSEDTHYSYISLEEEDRTNSHVKSSHIGIL